MKKRITISIFVVFLLCSSQVFTNQSSPGGGYTNAPGESNCSSCHASSISSGAIWNNIALTSTVSLGSFVGGTTYAMSLAFADSTSTKYGFQLTAVSPTATSTSPSLGTFSSPTSNTDVQLHSGYITGRTAVAHTSSGTTASTNSKVWTFNWTAPTTISSTSVKFYVMINSTDGDNTNSGDQPYSKFFTATVLPVKWLDFKAYFVKDNINLSWKTASEINNSHFEIEQSIDNSNWNLLAKIKGEGTSNTVSKYNYLVQNSIFTKQYFRLKQVDFDGKYEYSKAIEASKLDDNGTKISWNQMQKTLVVNINDCEKEISVMNLQGEVKEQKTLNAEDTYFNIASLPMGIYIVKVHYIGEDYFKKIMIN